MEKKHHILHDVEPDKAFWVDSGHVVRSLPELANILNHISDNSYNHHVNSEKNDFSTWVRDVIGESELADEIGKAKSKEKMIDIIRKRTTKEQKPEEVKPKMSAMKFENTRQAMRHNMEFFILGIIIGVIIAKFLMALG